MLYLNGENMETPFKKNFFAAYPLSLSFYMVTTSETSIPTHNTFTGRLDTFVRSVEKHSLPWRMCQFCRSGGVRGAGLLLF